MRVIEPEELFAFAQREGLLVDAHQPAPSVTEHVLPAVEVFSRRGKVCDLEQTAGHTSTSFKLRFETAIVWGGPLAVIHEDWLLPGGFCHQHVWIHDGLGCSNLDGALHLPKLPQVDVPLERPAIAGYCSHWGHFFTDTLDRLLALADAGEAKTPLLVDAKPICGNAVDLLFHAGLLTSPLELHPLKRDALYRVKNLEVYSLTSRKPSAPVDSFRRVRSALLTKHTFDWPEKARPLFVGRSQVALRRISNQSDLVAYLKSTGSADVFFPELHPITKAIEVFSSHATIVMPIGSAKFNLIFCRPGTRVICITPQGYAESNGSVCQLLRHICAGLEIDLSFYACASVPGQGTRAHMLLHHDLVFGAKDLDLMLSEV